MAAPAHGLIRRVWSCRPTDAEALDGVVRRLLGLRVPRRPLILDHQAPFDYLVHSFFERDPGDCVVWASRGGGKTMLGAVATLLDLLFKPGIQVRILGGSLEQSDRMYRYLWRMAQHPGVRRLLASEPTQRRIEMRGGGKVELLSQSQRSVRGTRVHKMRCDEVEEFEPEVWEAAQLVTRSGRCGSVEVRGAVEAFSTMHRPFGLMSRLTRRAAEHPGRTRMFRWCALDVIERCPPERDCRTCPLWDDCRGGARRADGFVRIDDLIAQRARVGEESWASEMMCQLPRRGDSVYPSFRVERHVFEGEASLEGAQLVAGMDFGLRSPLVMLWAVVRPGGSPTERVVEVIDEYVSRSLTLERNLERIAQRPWPAPEWIGVDPAGGQRNAHTGLTDIDVLRRFGHRVRSVRASIGDGVDRVRRRLDRGTLLIHRRCAALIEALTRYHFDPDRPQRDEPVKDGPDHACDALRYLVVSLERAGGPIQWRSYL